MEHITEGEKKPQGQNNTVKGILVHTWHNATHVTYSLIGSHTHAHTHTHNHMHNIQCPKRYTCYQKEHPKEVIACQNTVCEF